MRLTIFIDLIIYHYILFGKYLIKNNTARAKFARAVRFRNNCFCPPLLYKNFPFGERAEETFEVGSEFHKAGVQ